MPSLQELAAFETAARHGNFSRAAEELNLTQSAISKQVRQLEDMLGVRLFERQNRQVILTDAGQAFRLSAQDLLERLTTATHAVMASAGSDGALTVAVLPTFAVRWLIPRLPRFQAENPRIAITLRTRLEPFDMKDAGIDVAIHYGAAAWPGAEVMHLLDEVVVPVASPAYRHRMRLAAPEDLERADLLQLATRPKLWGDWFEMAGIAFDRPSRGPLFDQFSFTACAAMAGMGVALVPRFLIQEELQSRKLTILFDRGGMAGQGAYFAVVPFAKRSHPVVSRFLRWLRTEANRSKEDR